jgi:diaminohydroxyphosphoribosylaminopyrimidine deaminase/5-amino-6-(5-phosphoribosylamino)uracil reductase
MVSADAAFMSRALFHAARARGRTSPNPLVGAVVVTPDGVVVGHGFHERPGEPHAEVNALDMAGARARGATLYCTLEPCCHTGRTGPCAHRIAAEGISRVVAAVGDPDPRVSGAGFAFLRAQGIAVAQGVRADEAARLNQPYFTLKREGRPFVILKAAVSADWQVTARRGERTPLTSAAANRHAHQVRAEVDAIAVGSETVLVDDPLLTARGPFRARPLLRVILDRRLRTPLTARLLSTPEAGPVMIVTTDQSASGGRRRELEAAGAEVVALGEGTLSEALRLLGERGIASLLLEGGAGVQEAALEEDLVDFVRIYQTPRVVGSGGVRFLNGRQFSADRLFEARTEQLGPDLMIEGYVHRPR